MPGKAPERGDSARIIAAAATRLPVPLRSTYIDRNCGSDPALREHVNSLIASWEDGRREDVPGLVAAEMADQHPAETFVGRRIGSYRIVDEIARGGMGTVYRAVHADGKFAAQVAIKLITFGTVNEFIIDRFYREQQIMASLEHPNIARLIATGRTERGLPYLVMEYIDGQPIDQYCDEKRLSVRERLELFRTTCLAVQYAHDQLIIHRDIKPRNVLLGADGAPKLLDFGIAKMLEPQSWPAFDSTVTAVRLMTPEYASPEQILGRRVTASTDVYSLGVLLYELLTGRRPYRAMSPAPHELTRAICDVIPVKPSTVVRREADAAKISFDRGTEPGKLSRTLQGDLDKIVMMAMRKEPERRYRSVGEFAEDIRRHLEGLPVSARGDTFAYRALKFARRNRAAIAIGCAALAVLGVLSLRFVGAGDALGRTPAVSPVTTLAGDESQPVFSPDGSQFAFVWDADGESNHVYLRGLEGGQVSRLTNDPAPEDSPVWSPDGDSVAFIRQSPEGTAVFVAPARPRQSARKLIDLHLDRSDLSLISNGRVMDWSPDGKEIAVRDRVGVDEPYGIFLVSVKAGNRSRLTLPPAQTFGDRNPAFSPDGKQISFIRAASGGVNDLYTMPLGGGGARRLTFDDREILGQTWSRDGKKIVFSSNRLGSFSLWSVPASGGLPERVAGIGMYVADPVFSRNGSRLAYTSFAVDTNIWRQDLVATAPPTLVIASTLYDSSPSISPDGKMVAFRSSRSGTHEIWVASTDGADARQLTHFGGPLTGTPRWSPDGKWIAFDTRPEGQADIYVISSAGGQARRVTTEGSADVVPSWSRNGRWIYFASNRTGAWQVWKTPPEGGHAEQVTRLGGFAAYESHDGKYLYYAKGRTTGGLWRLQLDSQSEEPVLDQLKPGFWGYWAVGAKGIYFVDEPQSGVRGIYEYEFGPKRIRYLAGIAKRPMVGDSAFAISPDGRFVLYTQIDHSGSDIMLADYGAQRDRAK